MGYLFAPSSISSKYRHDVLICIFLFEFAKPSYKPFIPATIFFRVTVKLSCRMDFHNYPFDSHVCRFQVGSYFYLKDIVTCTSEYSDPMSLSRQRNLQHRIGFEELRGNETVIRLESGEYAACGFRILLSRKRHQMMFQIYLPCFLFVCVSWASFLIKPNVVPGRMALLVTLFLVLVNIFNTVRSNAPVPSGSTLNAIDFYLVTSIIMVFLALLEYAAVLLAMHVRRKILFPLFCCRQISLFFAVRGLG